eukprot:5087239-Ditylum_brightwellii.AAC.1
MKRGFHLTYISKYKYYNSKLSTGNPHQGAQEHTNCMEAASSKEDEKVGLAKAPASKKGTKGTKKK